MTSLAQQLIKGLFDETPVFDRGSKHVFGSKASLDANEAVAEKTYTGRALQAYHRLCEGIKRKGYEIFERSRSYLEANYGKGTRGYEDGRTIEVEPGNIKALLHEYAAKLLKGKTGRTHDELHPQIYSLAAQMERELAPALG